MRKLYFLLLMTLMPLMVSAGAMNVEVDGVSYYLVSSGETKTATITASPNFYSGNFVIPESVSYEGVIYSVTSIGNGAFYGCSDLISVTIPNSITTIEDFAFGECGLISITIPNSVSFIGESNFDGSPWYENQPDGIIYLGKVLYRYKGTMPLGTNINIEEGTLGIAGGAFKGCRGLTSVTIPNSVTSIGGRAFAGCYDLTSMTIPNSVTSIGEFSFMSCISLTSVTIPNNVTTISFGAFDGCSGLTSLTIPNSVTTIGDNAFDGCCGLTSITIPNSVTSIGGRAFSNCSGLTSVTIPNNVTSIGEWAFSYCGGLTHIKVEDGNTIYDSRGNCNAIIETQSNKLLSGCRNTIIPNSVTFIANGAFSGCTGLTSVTIPNIVTSIGNWAFSECIGLTSVTIPNSVTTLGNMAFSGCRGLTSVTIPNSVTTIGFGAFEDCSGLSSVTIPNNVTSIEGHTFVGCSSLVSVTIPKSVISIKKFAFYGCSSLTAVHCYAEIVPVTNKDAFDNSNIENATLYVSMDSMDDYQAAEPWNKFKEVLAMADEPPCDDVDAESITIGKSGKASYCGDKSLDFSYSDEVKAYIATGFDKDEGIIWLTRVKDVPAGVPVLIKGEANQTYQVPVTDSENSYYTNMFVGNTSGETVQITETEGDFVNYYLSGDGTFKSVNKSANIGNNKCYLQLPGTFNPAVAGATQKVTIKDIGKASYAAPVDLDFTNVEGLKAFTATGYDKSSKTIWLTRVMKVQKGEGVLLKGDAKDYEIPSAGVQSSYMNMFVGNTSGDKIQVQEKSEDGSQTNFYLNGDGAFVSVNGFVNIGNNKCYLELPTSMVTAAASTRGAEVNYLLEEPEIIKMPVFRSIDNDGDGTTGIKDQSSKFNVPSDAYYTLQGQRVAKPGKSLYIKNGKKVIIR